MNKRSYICLLILSACFILVGCAPSKVVIPPLQHNESIDIHVPKTAHVHWVPGKRVASEKPTYRSSSSNGLAGFAVDLIWGVADQQNRKNKPSEYSNEYGKADEVVFVTSLRDVLDQQNVFKKVKLTTDLSEVRPQDVLIKIYFKTARVVDISCNKLTVSLSIKAGNRALYERTYFVQNDPYGKSKAKTFVEKKTEVSKKLLALVVNGIKQWHKGDK